MKNHVIKRLTEDTAFEAAFELMQQLRPHLKSAKSFTQQLNRQSHQGYRLLGLWQDKKLTGLIGYRLSENLLYGHHIYVDDLVVDSSVRHLGHGSVLLNRAREEARHHGCSYLVLDTGLDKPLAQRFYLREGMVAKGVHFVQSMETLQVSVGP